jgi:hypothetical protein
MQHLVFAADLNGFTDTLDEDDMIADAADAPNAAWSEKETSRSPIAITAPERRGSLVLKSIDDLMHSDL